MTEIIRYHLDLAALPPLTDAQRDELTALAQMPDDQIDFSDIPPATDEFWCNATRGRFRLPPQSDQTASI